MRFPQYAKIPASNLVSERGIQWLQRVYIMRKQLRYDEIDKVLWNLKNAFYFIDLTLSDFETAASMKWRDFEDAIQASTAERINADYIITRNTKDFEGSKVKALTPEEYFTDIFSVNE